MSRTGYDRPADVLRNANIAMYRAKELGKQRYQFFMPELHARASAMGVSGFRIYLSPIAAFSRRKPVVVRTTPTASSAQPLDLAGSLRSARTLTESGFRLKSPTLKLSRQLAIYPQRCTLQPNLLSRLRLVTAVCRKGYERVLVIVTRTTSETPVRANGGARSNRP